MNVLVGTEETAKNRKSVVPSTYKKKTRITDSLQSTRNALAQHLDRATASMAVLDDSSHHLRAAVNTQSEASEEIKRGGKTIAELQWIEKKDQLMTRAAAILFLLVCIWIFNRRIPLITYAYRGTMYTAGLFSSPTPTVIPTMDTPVTPVIEKPNIPPPIHENPPQEEPMLTIDADPVVNVMPPKRAPENKEPIRSNP
jgi:flavin-binding protein dodecin